MLHLIPPLWAAHAFAPGNRKSEVSCNAGSQIIVGRGLHSILAGPGLIPGMNAARCVFGTRRSELQQLAALIRFCKLQVKLHAASPAALLSCNPHLAAAQLNI